MSNKYIWEIKFITKERDKRVYTWNRISDEIREKVKKMWRETK